MNILDHPHIGNANLLQAHKVAFLAPSHISTLSVLPTLEWASTMSRKEDVAVISGFSSRMEQEVLDILLRGKCGIIIMLGRMLYKQVPEAWQEPLARNSLLVISTNGQPRQSRLAAKERNEQVVQLADEAFMPCIPPKDSSLHELYENHKATEHLGVLLQKAKR